MIYFDNNSTTRMFKIVVEAMEPFFTEQYANPSSAIAHFSGISRAITLAKSQISRVLGIENNDQLIITSGATESNNLAILGAAKATSKRHIITSEIEHPSVLEPIESLRKEGYRVTLLPIEQDGVILSSRLAESLCSDTAIVSLMMVNNETGVIQPVHHFASIVKNYDSSIIIHTDATQAIGKLPINLTYDLGDVDLLSFSAHKFHGPKGCGGLFVRNSNAITPIVFGGGQQRGIRSGTENPAGLMGMAEALKIIFESSGLLENIRPLRDRLESEMLSIFPKAFVLGASASRLPTTLNICLPELDAEALVDQFAAQEIAISAGSACSFAALRPSHVALAHGLTYEQAKCCIRLSLSIESTQQEVSSFMKAFAEIITKIDNDSISSAEAFA